MERAVKRSGLRLHHRSSGTKADAGPKGEEKSKPQKRGRAATAPKPRGIAASKAGRIGNSEETGERALKTNVLIQRVGRFVKKSGDGLRRIRD